MTKIIGKHILIDGFVSGNTLNTLELIYDFLIDLAKSVNMTIVAPPTIIRFPYNEDLINKMLDNVLNYDSEIYKTLKHYIHDTHMEFSGYSGVIFLMESHISIHTFPDIQSDKGFFITVDLYSCKLFDEKSIKEILEKYSILYGNVKIINRIKDDSCSRIIL